MPQIQFKGIDPQLICRDQNVVRSLCYAVSIAKALTTFWPVNWSIYVPTGFGTIFIYADLSKAFDCLSQSNFIARLMVSKETY